MVFVFAFASLMFAALNDVFFKLYARKQRSRGLYVFAIGVVWTLVFLAVTIFNGGSVFSRAVLFWGCLSGIFSVAANIMLIESMTRYDVGICSSIYRLNLVPAAVLAILFLNEDMTVWKIVGVCFAGLSVLMFVPSSRQWLSAVGNLSAVALAAGAGLLRAGMGLSYKCAMLRDVDRMSLLCLNGVMWILGGLVYTAVRERRIPKPPAKLLAYGAFSGVLVCGIVLFMLLALQCGDASIVLPVTQLSFLLTAMIGVVFLNEPLGPRKVLALLCGVACVLTMTMA